MTADNRFFLRLGRITVVTGHYGSGKTEFAVSLTMQIAASRATRGVTNPVINEPFERLAIIDLDIVNPYFRSRERRDTLGAVGISVYGSVYDFDATAELPALGANIRTPLEDKGCRVIIDAGGDDSGALVLNQFVKYLVPAETTTLAVVNANRPETATTAGALGHIAAIESATGLNINGVVSNCHLLRETTAETIIKGHKLCVELCKAAGKKLICDCYPEGVVDPRDLMEITGSLMPLGLYMRPTWLDK